MSFRNILIFVVLAHVMCVLSYAQESQIEKDVQELLKKYQSGSIEVHSELVELGPEAVPALCNKLADYPFPLKIIEVLGEIQASSAVPYLIDYIENDVSRHYRSDVIRALKNIGDQRAEDILVSIEKNESIYVGVRFEATVALARIGSPSVKALAWDKLTHMYRTGEGVADNAYQNSDVILTHDFYMGLCEVQTDEIDEAIASYIRYGGRGGERVRVMGQLVIQGELRNRPKIIKALLYVAENEYKMDIQGDELITQGAAFTSLLGLDVVPPEQLLTITESWEEAIGNAYIAFGKDSEFVTDYATRLWSLKKKLLERYPHLHDKQKKVEPDMELAKATVELRADEPKVTEEPSSKSEEIPLSVEDMMLDTQDVPVAESDSEELSDQDSRFIFYGMLACAFVIASLIVVRKFKKD